MKSGWGQIFQICQEARPEAQQELGLRTIRQNPAKDGQGVCRCMQNWTPVPALTLPVVTSCCATSPQGHSPPPPASVSIDDTRDLSPALLHCSSDLSIDHHWSCQLSHLFWQNRSRTGRGRTYSQISTCKHKAALTNRPSASFVEAWISTKGRGESATKSKYQTSKCPGWKESFETMNDSIFAG